MTLDRWATWREIHAQPAIWRDWDARLDRAGLRAWIAAQAVDEVWLTGAGTSAYIGDIVAAGLGGRLRSVPTTDIVSRPAILKERRPLVVSFGRSGDSAETLGTLDALDVLAPDAPRLNVICNPQGALATRPSRGPQRVILLPAATHDAGFAMTSSFTTMLLTALALFDPEPGPFEPLADALDRLLPDYSAAAAATAVPGRIVFLGTGPLAFAAREAALKVMELTAGRVAALWDWTLGFRHGPKSFVTGDCRIVAFLSAEATAARYEFDLVAELQTQFPDTLLTLGPEDFALPGHAPAWTAPLAVAFAQVLGVTWSDRLSLDVDDPFRGRGTLSRVVSGVKLYPVTA